MNFDDTFSIFIDRLDCAFSQIETLDLIPAFSDDHWNLILSPYINIYRLNEVPRRTTNPLSLLLIGSRLNKNIYGERKDYKPYTNGHYPYMAIERMFGFRYGLIKNSFMDGFMGKPERRIYSDGSYAREGNIMYNTGRFFLDIHFDHGRNLKISYNGLHFFKPIRERRGK